MRERHWYERTPIHVAGVLTFVSAVFYGLGGISVENYINFNESQDQKSQDLQSAVASLQIENVQEDEALRGIDAAITLTHDEEQIQGLLNELSERIKASSPQSLTPLEKVDVGYIKEQIVEGGDFSHPSKGFELGMGLVCVTFGTVTLSVAGAAVAYDRQEVINRRKKQQPQAA